MTRSLNVMLWPFFQDPKATSTLFLIYINDLPKMYSYTVVLSAQILKNDRSIFQNTKWPELGSKSSCFSLPLHVLDQAENGVLLLPYTDRSCPVFTLHPRWGPKATPWTCGCRIIFHSTTAVRCLRRFVYGTLCQRRNLENLSLLHGECSEELYFLVPPSRLIPIMLSWRKYALNK